MSSFGDWADQGGLPVFCYRADQRSSAAAAWDRPGRGRTSRHWACVGNRRIQLVADNEGRCGLWDTHDGSRWLTAADESGTGVSRLASAGRLLGTGLPDWPPASAPERRFGPTWLEVGCQDRGLTLTRLTCCPEGERPWVLIRVSVRNGTDAAVAGTLSEEWALRPRFAQLGTTGPERARTAAERVSYQVSAGEGVIRAAESFAGPPDSAVFGAPRKLVLEALGPARRAALPEMAGGADHPVLRLAVPVRLAAGEQAEFWFRFGADDGATVGDPGALLADSVRALRARLPAAAAAALPEAGREIRWHAALLAGGACADGVLGGHTLDQGSAYAFELGFNGAARDPLQHALPLVYAEPDLALSVLRNTCAWSDADGRVPWALDGAKQPCTYLFDPSDQPLWALWLAAEYAAATGDLAAFTAPLRLHPATGGAVVPVHEALRRQFRYFVDRVGRGSHGHVRMMNADWNDLAISESGAGRAAMIADGESVLNSAMAAWVLPVWAGLAARLGDQRSAVEARALGVDLRQAVAAEWNGQWFRRAYGPGAPPIGDHQLWLEVQPWAILCGAADEAQARALLQAIDAGPRAGSPLGARVKWPLPPGGTGHPPGEGTGGGIWYSINMTLVWAAARLDPALAWDEWQRMTLAAHERAYPGIWEGTISGPDSYNSPEADHPGRTWAHPGGRVAMQAFPVGNLHSHAQPLLAYLRLLGVEPTADGTLRTGGGAAWASQTFSLEPDGHGRLAARGPVTVESRAGTVTGAAGEVRW
jgi:hypothetical protein